jgi:tripartite ATP-independent transporter DctP family solute receptor
VANLLRNTLAAIGLLASVFSGVATASETSIKLKMGHILPPDSPDHKAFEFFAKRVNDLSKGEIAVEIFHSSQLGSVDVMMESLKTGSLDLMVELLEFWASSDKRFGVVGVPYLFESRAHFERFLNSDTFAGMAKDLAAANNLVVVGNPVEWQFQSDRTLLATKPIITPADLKGVKLRMFQSRLPILSWQTLGANTVVLPWSETYIGLSTGTIEAVTARIEAHYQMKQTEVAKYLTVTEEYYQAYMPIMSKATADKLSPEQMTIVRQALSEAGAEFMRLSAEMTGAYRNKVRSEHGVTVIYPPLGPWIEAMKPVHAQLESIGGLPQSLIDEVKALR